MAVINVMREWFSRPTLVDVLSRDIARTPAGPGSLIDGLAIDIAVANGRDEIERLDAAIRSQPIG